MSNLSIAIIAGTAFAVVLILIMKWVGRWADRKYERIERRQGKREDVSDE